METLYNGIVLPDEWPPRNVDFNSKEPMPVPYLDAPPELLPIDVGRQLFVDDFLIERTDLARVFHYPEKYEGNPILKPETDLEFAKGSEEIAIACPKSGGLWWDYDERLFKLWYEAGFWNAVCYATSEDGLHWTRPSLNVVQAGTNRVSPLGAKPDSWTVVPDYLAKNPQERYKIFFQEPCADGRALCYVSPDGLSWGRPVASGFAGDRSTMFFNPFRKKWVFSLRSGYGWRLGVEGVRSRHYWEDDDFLNGSQWVDVRPGRGGKAVAWVQADRLDLPDPEIGRPAQLYNLDAVAYESLMLGFFEIHLGPRNEDCAKVGLPKITELNFAYSRDGFHWHRPDRTAAIKAERKDVWDRGYVQSLGNICTVGKDRIWIYYIGFRGNPHHADKGKGMYDNGATGVAFLRRDGFASMDGRGSLTTRPVIFNGSKLFVNADASKGELRAEILDDKFQPLEPFTAESCLPLKADSTLHPIRWRLADDLAALKGKSVRFRFTLNGGSLYSFWVSKDASGRSDGYVAGGGPDYTGPVDTVGCKP